MAVPAISLEVRPLASGSSGNSYFLNDGSTKILIEAGIPWKQVQRKLDFKTHEITAVLISHRHGDHSGHVKDAVKAGINVYLTEDARDALGIDSHRIHVITPGRVFTLNTWQVLAFELEHDVPNVGFLIATQAGEKLVYITDSAYCKFRFNALNFILIECNYADDILTRNVDAGTVAPELRKRIIQSHFSLSNVKKFLQANDLSQVREIHLIHLSDLNSHAERFKKEIQGLTGIPTFI